MSKHLALLVNVTVGVYIQKELVEGKHTTCPLDLFLLLYCGIKSECVTRSAAQTTCS